MYRAGSLKYPLAVGQLTTTCNYFWVHGFPSLYPSQKHSPECDAKHKLLASFQIPLNPSINRKTVNLIANNLHPTVFFMVK